MCRSIEARIPKIKEELKIKDNVKLNEKELEERKERIEDERIR